MNQIGHVLAFHYTQVFQASHSIVADFERLFLDRRTPPSKREKSKGFLFARVNNDVGTRGLELRAAPLSQDRNQRRRNWRISQVPGQRRFDQRWCSLLHHYYGLLGRVFSQAYS